ncbi:MAG: S8 family serine peptidase [Candidatus Caenarcaniphilales bacterium]|nr:S8 family serine peptidase [Candidatus Caenarcaniphilales bacterium]
MNLIPLLLTIVFTISSSYIPVKSIEHKEDNQKIDCSSINKDLISIIVKYKTSKKNNVSLLNQSINQSNIKLKDEYELIKKKYTKKLGKSSQFNLSLNATNTHKRGEINKVKIQNYVRDGDITCEDYKNIINKLKKQINIEYAEPNYIINSKNLSLAPNDTLLNKKTFESLFKVERNGNFYLEDMNIFDAWNFSQGDDIVVAVIDTGVDYNHPDLWNNIWVNPLVINDVNFDGKIDLNDADINGNKRIDPDELKPDMIGYDFVSKDIDPNDQSFLDDNSSGFFTSNLFVGHGTHIAGVIAAEANNNLGIAGVAPKAKILPIRALSSLRDFNSLSDLVSALIFVADLEIVDITNNSWVTNFDSQLLKDAFDVLEEKGILSIASAGNDNSSEAFYPAAYDNVISVGSIETNNIFGTVENRLRDYNPSKFSNHGKYVDIAAPGEFILSTAREFDYERQEVIDFLERDQAILEYQSNGFGYGYLSGTSIAAPIVSGLTALILKMNPNLNLEQVKKILQTSSRPISSSQFRAEEGQNFYVGKGIIDAIAALVLSNNNSLPIATLSKKKYSGSNTIEIRGNAYSDDFSHYEIKVVPFNKHYSNEQVVYSNSFETAVNNNLLASIDLSSMPDGNYHLILTTFDSSGLQALDIADLSIGKADKPSNLSRYDSGSYPGEQIIIRWDYKESSANINNITGFEVHRNGVKIAFINLESAEVKNFEKVNIGDQEPLRYEYKDLSIEPSSSYEYKIRTVSANGDLGEFSSITTTSGLASQDPYKSYFFSDGAIGFDPGVDGILGKDGLIKSINAMQRLDDLLYLADGHSVRSINLRSLELKTLAGSLFFTEESYDGIGLAARFNELIDIEVLNNGKLLLLESPILDTSSRFVNYTGKLRLFDPSSSEVTTLLDNSSNAQGILATAVNQNNIIYAIDGLLDRNIRFENGISRKIDNERIVTINNSGEVQELISHEMFLATALNKNFFTLTDIHIDLNGDLLISSKHEIFKYSFQNQTLNSIIGSDNSTNDPTGNLKSAYLREIKKIDTDSKGNIYILESFGGILKASIGEDLVSTAFDATLEDSIIGSKQQLNKPYGAVSFPEGHVISSMYIDNKDSIFFQNQFDTDPDSFSFNSTKYDYLSRAILTSNFSDEYITYNGNQNLEENEKSDELINEDELTEDSVEKEEENNDFNEIVDSFKDQFSYEPSQNAIEIYTKIFSKEEITNLKSSMNSLQLINSIIDNNGKFRRKKARLIIKDYKRLRKSNIQNNSTLLELNDFNFDFNQDGIINKSDLKEIRSINKKVRRI